MYEDKMNDLIKRINEMIEETKFYDLTIRKYKNGTVDIYFYLIPLWNMDFEELNERQASTDWEKNQGKILIKKTDELIETTNYNKKSITNYKNGTVRISFSLKKGKEES